MVRPVGTKGLPAGIVTLWNREVAKGCARARRKGWRPGLEPPAARRRVRNRSGRRRQWWKVVKSSYPLQVKAWISVAVDSCQLRESESMSLQPVLASASARCRRYEANEMFQRNGWTTAAHRAAGPKRVSCVLSSGRPRATRRRQRPAAEHYRGEDRDRALMAGYSEYIRSGRRRQGMCETRFCRHGSTASPAAARRSSGDGRSHAVAMNAA